MHSLAEEKAFQCNHKEMWIKGKILEINRTSEVNSNFSHITEKALKFNSSTRIFLIW